MNKKIKTVTQTAAMLALLICLQWVGSMFPDAVKQIVTGTFVNCVLAVTVLIVGLTGGITVALISPICAFLLGIAPNLVTVIPIMIGNTCYVVLLKLLMSKTWSQPYALVVAAAVKFGVLYLLVVKVICGLSSGALLGKKLGDTVVLAPPMLKMLPTMFTWPQLITALTGGTLALLIVPVVKRGIKN